ncbi:MAG: hypothetical protein JHC26_10680 [Thermofilum sp.]|jgi:hypothetical protein|uniref:hypothetical protein n=1 Tax=Thermofilum sp. TaxID=1961369 RepID=UPI002587CCCB|nr:hypothetical protein [Thermofilum sp.]MCI4409546.1 hypothetical protein [Thermofilum sp.]
MIQPTGIAVTALQEEFTSPQWLYFIVVLFGIILILWAIMELVSSLIFRKTLSDTIQATLTTVSTSINVNTQYLTDSLIKLAQLGHAERLEHIRMSQMFINEAFTTAKTAIVLDQLTDMVKELEPTGGSK